MPNRKRKGSKSPSPMSKRLRTSETPVAPKAQSAGALPTSDEWAFRLKILSSAAGLDDDILKDAVQGLVNICFPDRVLDELGVDVVAAHMRNQNAPEANINKMRTIFNDSMIQRVAAMLVTFLDTPDKLADGIAAVTAIAERLHGGQLRQDSEDSPDDVADAFQEGHAGLDEAASEVSPLPKKKKSKADKRGSQARHQRVREAGIHTPNNGRRSETLEHLPVDDNASSVGKDKKVSSSWRWDVQPDSVSLEDIPNLFKRTSDLFAYHALPIVRRELDPSAKRKAIRERIDARLSEMSQEEYQQWVESLEKLKSGDLMMLERIAPDETSSRDMARATPAPSTYGRPRETFPEVNVQQASQRGDVTRVRGVGSAGSQFNIKNETSIGNGGTPPMPSHGSRDKSEESLFSRVANDLSKDPVQAIWQKGALVSSLLLQTPFLDPNAGESAIKKIMQNLNKRVAQTSIGIIRFNGEAVVYTKQQLSNDLHKGFSYHGQPVKRLIEDIEWKLVPFAIANPATFPELITSPIFFTQIMGNITPVMDLIYGTSTEPTEMVQWPIERISERGIPLDTPCGLWRTPLRICWGTAQKRAKKWDDTTKRGCLERVVRGVAFTHRNKFPELQSSPLVRAWESKTGLKW